MLLLNEHCSVWGSERVNTVVTSREAILKGCRELVEEQGLEKLNIRAVAKRCGISIGAVYHYFPSKDSLSAAAVGEVWREIFHAGACGPTGETFPQAVRQVFENFRVGMARYPNFFTVHSLAFSGGGKEEARQAMTESFSHMKAGLLSALNQDPAVEPRAFTPAFSREQFVDFVFSSLVSLLAQGAENCGVLLEIVSRVIGPAQEHREEKTDAGDYGNSI